MPLQRQTLNARRSDERLAFLPLRQMSVWRLAFLPQERQTLFSDDKVHVKLAVSCEDTCRALIRP